MNLFLYHGIPQYAIAPITAKTIQNTPQLIIIKEANPKFNTNKAAKKQPISLSLVSEFIFINLLNQPKAFHVIFQRFSHEINYQQIFLIIAFSNRF